MPRKHSNAHSSPDLTLARVPHATAPPEATHIGMLHVLERHGIWQHVASSTIGAMSAGFRPQGEWMR